jgi:hypothetical protein
VSEVGHSRCGTGRPPRDAGLGAPSAEIRALLRSNQPAHAADLTAQLISSAFGLEVTSAEFTMDAYSLNSVSGKVHLADGSARFFKFHQEDREQSNVPEYYRDGLLKAAGLPVETPVAVSSSPGRQIALYALRAEPRLADVCLGIERRDGSSARLPVNLARARRALDHQIGEVLVTTLRPASAASAQSAIHQLFYHRLANPGGRFPGGRYRDWYSGAPGWGDLAARRWRINGVEYTSTLEQLAKQAAHLLAPARLARMPTATAHGDDHQGNIWVVCDERGGAELRLFDCAFAGNDIPALLAPVKATFHNVFAHPFWLYHPAEAARRCQIDISLGDGTIDINHNATPSPLRRELLRSLVELVWAPLLRALRDRGQLTAGWRPITRSALFTCPLLVTNLLATHRPEPTRMLGLACAVAVGSESADGADLVSRTLDELTPGQNTALSAEAAP